MSTTPKNPGSNEEVNPGRDLLEPPPSPAETDEDLLKPHAQTPTATDEDLLKPHSPSPAEPDKPKDGN